MAEVSKVVDYIRKNGIKYPPFKSAVCNAKGDNLKFLRRKIQGVSVWYEVWPRTMKLFGQLRIRGENIAFVQQIKCITKSHPEFECAGKDADFGVHGGSPISCAGMPVKNAAGLVVAQLVKLADVFEEFILSQQSSSVGRELQGVRSHKIKKTKPTPMICAPNTVTFKPYVGSAYEKNKETEFKKRILVVGASHYCSYYKRETGCSPKCEYYGKKSDVGRGGKDRYCGKKCELLSEKIINAYRDNDQCKSSGWKRTFTKFTNSFINKRATGFRMPANSDVFSHLVDVEYVQGVEGVSHDDTNQEVFSAERNFKELTKVIRKMKSEVVVLWGRRVVGQVYAGFGKPNSASDVEEVDFDGRKIKLVACRRHPSSNKWDANDLRKLLTQVGVCLLEAN